MYVLANCFTSPQIPKRWTSMAPQIIQYSSKVFGLFTKQLLMTVIWFENKKQ